MHSAYDYIFKSVSKTIQTAMVLAGWCETDGSKYVGGVPPTIEEITSEVVKIDDFISHMYQHQLHVSDDVKKLLVASVFRFYDDFLGMLLLDPSNKYGDSLEDGK